MIPDGGGLPEPEQPVQDEDRPPAIVRLEFLLNGASPPEFGRGGPARPVRLVWHDDAGRSLAAAGLALSHDGSQWSLEWLAPGLGQDWPACRPPAPLAVGDDLQTLPLPPTASLQPVGAFEGTIQRFPAGETELDVLRGIVRGVATERTVCRLRLAGPAEAVAARLAGLPSPLLSVPRASLAREALAVADSTDLPPRHLGSPALDGETAVVDGLAAVISHLLDALLFWSDRLLRQREAEAVHQSRVATRRLRSALSIYRSADPPALSALGDDVRACAAALGAVRDWDVFLGGIGATLREAGPEDDRVAILLRTAARQREAAWAGLALYLGSPAFHALTLHLGAFAAMPPTAGAAALAGSTRAFAASVLTRRLKRVRHAGRGMRELPIEALHELRKDCKRLRYAAEFFLPAFGAKQSKPFVHRLSELQEELGTLNDAATCAVLIGQLGRAGRGYAGGMAAGLAAAAAQPARKRIQRRWKRFKRVQPFWD